METTVKIICENNQSSLFVNMGSSLLDVLEILHLKGKYPFLAAYVNNSIKELNYRIYKPITVRFINVADFEGVRVYQRTLFFVLQKATMDLFPANKLKVKYSVSKGIYCELTGKTELSLEEVDAIWERMRKIIDQNIPIVRQMILREEAEKLYERLGFDDKVRLLRTRPYLYVPIYSLADLVGYFHGVLAPSTGYVNQFGLTKYYNGFHVAMPYTPVNPDVLSPIVPQAKMFDIFKEFKQWVDIIGVADIGSLNEKILDKQGSRLVKIAEAFHEKKLVSIADTIYERNMTKGTRMVLISGPSSSGKTTFAKRLGIQLSVMGLDPVLISIDDYFVNREDTPLDEKGQYDFEALEAIDIPLFTSDMQRLMNGEEVNVARYDFITGKRVYEDRMLKLTDRSILVIEGIHGLNPRLTEAVDSDLKFKIYLTALTAIAMDDMSRVPTTDNRLIRRMVRDYYTRGNNAVATLRMWPSVRRGEDRHIFPYQEEADVMFNSSLFYELAVLKSLVEPMLREIPNSVPEYGEARRIMSMLDKFIPLNCVDEVPPTSILREFIGGSSFKY